MPADLPTSSGDAPAAERTCFLVFSPAGGPQYATARATYDEAMRACFGRRDCSVRYADWWQHNLDEGWTCRPVSLDAPDPAVAGVAVPVAWRYRDHDWTAWLYSDKKPRESADWRFVEPVYAAPTPRAALEGASIARRDPDEEWFWNTIDGFGFGAAQEDEREALEAICRRATSAPDPWRADTHDIEIDYTNYRGERSTRTVVPTGRLLLGDDTYHPTARWVIQAWDVEKGAMRTFDPAHIHAWGDQVARADTAPARGAVDLAGVEAALDAVRQAATKPGRDAVTVALDVELALDAAIAALQRDAAIARTSGAGSGVAVPRDAIGRPRTPEDLAQFLHDEVHDYGHDWTWPEHDDDTGKREGGYVRLTPTDVRLTPTDVRLECRDQARRIWGFLGFARISAEDRDRPACGATGREG